MLHLVVLFKLCCICESPQKRVYKKCIRTANCGRNICDTFRPETVTECTCRNWFKKFRPEYFYLRNVVRSYRRSKLLVEELEPILRNIKIREMLRNGFAKPKSD